MRPITADAQAQTTHIVRDADLATNWANDLPVLATPVLLWLAERACMAVLDDALEDGEMSVGYRHDEAQHLAATPAGWHVILTARLVRQAGSLLEFEVWAEDGQEVVYRGRHTRAIVDRARFVGRLQAKAASAAGVRGMAS